MCTLFNNKNCVYCQALLEVTAVFCTAPQASFRAWAVRSTFWALRFSCVGPPSAAHLLVYKEVLFTFLPLHKQFHGDILAHRPSMNIFENNNSNL